MLKNIFNTFFTKALTASMNLVAIIILSRILGAEGKGISSLIITTVSFFLVFSNLFAGTTIVYFIPRISNSALVWLGYGWTFLTCAIGYIFLKISGLVPETYIWHITIIAGIQSLLVIHSKWLLGKEEVAKSNMLTIVQSGLMLLSTSVLFGINVNNISTYISGLYISYGVAYLVSVWNTKVYWEKADFKELFGRFQELFTYGLYNQADNILYLLTLRANFYMLEYFHGSASLGIYSNGVALAEAVWLITYSVSLVLYSRLSNSQDVVYAQKITWLLAKMTLYVSVLGVLVAAALPETFYVAIFGAEFSDVPKILWIFAPGVSIFSCALVIIHYFSGIGRFRWNALFSLIGFSLVWGLGYLMIPTMGYMGAAISASSAYAVTGIVVLIVFIKESNTKPAELLPTKADFMFVKKMLF